MPCSATHGAVVQQHDFICVGVWADWRLKLCFEDCAAINTTACALAIEDSQLEIGHFLNLSRRQSGIAKAVRS